MAKRAYGHSMEKKSGASVGRRREVSRFKEGEAGPGEGLVIECHEHGPIARALEYSNTTL